MRARPSKVVRTALRSTAICPAGVPEEHRGLVVDPGPPHLGQGLDAVGVRPQDHRGESEGVDADVEQAAAAQAGVEQPLRGIEAGAEAELGVEHAHLADGPGGQPFPHFDHPRDEARPHRLHQEQLPRARRRDHLLGLAGVEGERLFAKHRFARLQGEQGVIAVERVRTGDVDDVDAGVGDELGVRTVAARNFEAVAEGFGGVEGAGADRGRFRRQAPRTCPPRTSRPSSRWRGIPSEFCQSSFSVRTAASTPGGRGSGGALPPPSRCGRFLSWRPIQIVRLHSGVAFDRSCLTRCSGAKRVCKTPLPLTRGWAFWVFYAMGIQMGASTLASSGSTRTG